MKLFGLIIMTIRRANEIESAQRELIKAIDEQRMRTEVMKRKRDMAQGVVVGLQRDIERLKEGKR